MHGVGLSLHGVRSYLPAVGGSPYREGSREILRRAGGGLPTGGHPPGNPLPSARLNEPVGMGETPVALGETPVALGETPVALGEMPVALGETPVALGEMPVALGETPIAEEEAPAARCGFR